MVKRKIDSKIFWTRLTHFSDSLSDSVPFSVNSRLFPEVTRDRCCVISLEHSNLRMRIAFKVFSAIL